MRLLLFLALSGLFIAPIAARADLWVNVKAPLMVDASVLPDEGCELMHRTSSGDTVRCSNRNSGNEFNRVLKGGQIPQWRVMYFNDPKKKKVYPATCVSNFRYDGGNNRWDAETGPRSGLQGSYFGCLQYWHNNNTLDVFYK